VDPGSVSLSSRSYRPDPTTQTRALNIARGCVYRPGTLNGETVAVRHTTTLRMERPAGSLAADTLSRRLTTP
jgi:hypothetical protein